MKSNGWMDGTAALQLFTHLDGEALNVALLMPEEERAKWEGLSQGLSDYYNSAAIRESDSPTGNGSGDICHRTVRGFGDMGKRARDLMIRDRFIAAQRNCGLRRHLDGVSSDTRIRDIVDRCRVWESHSEQEPSSGAGRDQDSLGEYGDSQELGCLQADSQELMVCTGMDSRVPVPVVGVIPRNVETQRKVGNGDGQLAPLEVLWISSLVTQLLRTTQEGRLADEKVPPEGGMGSSSAVPPVTSAERGHSVREWMRVCFSCGCHGHGVNRCSQVDTSFPFLPQGWSVDVRNGQYRVIQTSVTGMWSAPGNEGWSGREGQPPRSSGTKVQLTPAGESVDRGEVSRHGSCRWGVGLDPAGLQAHRLFRHWGAIPLKLVDRITEPKWCWEVGTRLCRSLRRDG